VSDAALAAYAARLRGLAAMAGAAARNAAPRVEGVVKATATGGTDVDGRPWLPKKDGTRALANAASAISVAVRGVAIVVTLQGAYVYHQFSKSRQRRILPDAGAGMPARIAGAVRAAATDAFQRTMR
jgi:hypothetical protein